MDPISILPQLLRAIAQIAQAPATKRNDIYIRVLKQFRLDPRHPPAEFDGVYAYALVEYALAGGEDKSETMLRLLADATVKAAFHESYKRWDGAAFQEAIAREVNPDGYHDGEWQEWTQRQVVDAQWQEWSRSNVIGVAIADENTDVQREVTVFFSVFLDVVRRSQTPKEQMQTVMIAAIQQDMQALRTQLTQEANLAAANFETLTDAVADKLQARLQRLLPGGQATDSDETVHSSELAQQLDEWFQVLGYGRERHSVVAEKYFEWIITIPVRRRRYDRIVVRGVTGEAGLSDLQGLREAVAQHQADEGWLVSSMRVSSGARQAAQADEQYDALTCYTLDELLDEDADFSQYLEWLEAEIKQRRIDQDYIPLGCRKDEIDPKSQQKIGISYYGEEEGWIEGYVEQWLADPAKEHLSVLGEFGTGKTWFALHYAWLALQKYQDAKQRRVERPRLPLVIPLRDYAKAVSVESLFSEFFFRKHEIPLPGYSAFEQLNRMGKLLLIFDGFDEMAARINQQAMIDNFWELSKAVVPGAKAVLTCRTEHFPNAIQGRRLLNAELKASTAALTGEPPQFEVLELAKFSDEQIGELLGRKASGATVAKVVENPQLLDLARRPVMVELILEALPDIEAGKPIDMARVYLYAVTTKMARDITSERTFTSLADKLYFLCELSWEMLSTNQMSLNYLAFPERLQRLFGERLQEERELDHWRYDMMGQTMLIRNSEGDYSPAHRSLLEFFVAYKIVASLGAMAEDFTAVARQQSHLDESLPPESYTWEGYFKRACDGTGTPMPMAGLDQFEALAFDDWLPLLQNEQLAKAVVDLAHPMLDRATMAERLVPLIQATRQQEMDKVRHGGSNVIRLLLAADRSALNYADLSETVLLEPDFDRAYLRGVNLANAHFQSARFNKVLGQVLSLDISPDGSFLAVGEGNGVVQIWDLKMGHLLHFCKGHQDWVRMVMFSPDGKYIASGSDDKSIKLWSTVSGECLKTLQGHQKSVKTVVFSSDGLLLASGSADHSVKLWSRQTGRCLRTIDGHQGWVVSVMFSPDGRKLVSSSDDKSIKLWSSESGECLKTLEGHQASVLSVVFSPDGQWLASSSVDKSIKLWSSESGECLKTLEGHQDWVRTVVFSPDGQRLASGSSDNSVKLWSSKSGECLKTLKGHQDWIGSVVFSPDGQRLASSSESNNVKLWSGKSGECLKTLGGHQSRIWSVVFSPDGQRLASGSADKSIKLWSSDSGECLKTLEGHQGRVWSVVFNPDGQKLASGSSDNSVKLWSSELGKCLQTLEGHQDWVFSVMFSPDGRRLASGSADNSVKLWSSDSGECLKTLKEHQDGVQSVVFSPDGQRLASGSADNSVKLWSSQSGGCLKTLEGHQARVLSVAFSPDGHLLASSSRDNSIKLWSSQSGECLKTLDCHQNWVLSVVFSPDGRRLVSGSADQRIRVWDVATGKCLLVIEDNLCTGLDITGTKGLTEGQRTALKLMGTVERF